MLTISLVASLAGRARGQSIGDLLPIAVPGFAVAPGVTAQSRLHPEDAALGVTLGLTPDDLVVYPALSASAGVDSAPGAGQGGSVEAMVQPSVRIDDAALGLVGYATADLSRYTGDASANSNDVIAGVGLALPLGANTITLGAARIATQETALGVALPGGSAPFGVVVDDGRIAARLALGAIDATGRFEISRAALSASTGSLLPAFRNQTLIRASSEIATADDGVLRWLGLLKVSEARYRRTVPGDGFANATAIALLGGFETDGTDIARLRLLGGLVHQSFASAMPPASTTPIVSAGLGWTPDGLISLDMEFSRQAGLETTLGTPGTAVNTASLAVAESYARDLLLTASIDARSGTVAQHAAREFDFVLGASWHVSRAFAVAPKLSYSCRHGLPGSAPREARAMVGVVWAP
ncbi:MAG: outer membrane beta-barrel protein [Acidiphilium sp.]|nr:outer membrane beta-barrel protein [Acidiphilium sp.]MDD4934882.1 outer membrane beta-barrel protein [Acidiphilium sp.]